MAIEHWHRYTREQIRANPDTLFVFGDNLIGEGLGGQAKEARGGPNAVGVPTKRKPTMEDDAFLTDADLAEVQPIIQERFRQLAAHVKAGKRVVYPADGLGSGRAQLHARAPAVAAFISNCARHLMKLEYDVSWPKVGGKGAPPM